MAHVVVGQAMSVIRIVGRCLQQREFIRVIHMCHLRICLLPPCLLLVSVVGRRFRVGVHLGGLWVGGLHVCRLHGVVRGAGCMEMGHYAWCVKMMDCTTLVGIIRNRICVWCAVVNTGQEQKTLQVSSGIQVGSPILDNASGDAGLADYLRWAPESWPIEAWECRVILSPFSRRGV